MSPAHRVVCDCERAGYYRSGVPGILARVVDCRVVEDGFVERCDVCERYLSDTAAQNKLIELGMLDSPLREIDLPAAFPKAMSYLQEGGLHCPQCGSEQIEGGSFESSGGSGTQEIGCLKCGAEWYDIFELVNITQIRQGTPTVIRKLQNGWFEPGAWPYGPKTPSDRQEGARQDAEPPSEDL